MNSPPNTSNALIARADEQLARIRERIASADEDIARVTGQLSKMEQDDARDSSDRPQVYPANSSAGPAPEPPRGNSRMRGYSGLLGIGLALAACLVVAFLVSQLSREGITLLGARRTPQNASTPISAPTNLQPAPPLEPAKAETAALPPASIAQTKPPDAAPTDAKVSELMQLQQAMARDVAGLKQEIEQLKARQDQLASDNSRVIEQLKAKQEEMARPPDKVSIQSALPVTSPPSAAPTQSPQVRLRPRAPRPRRHYPPPWQYYDDGW